jgi:hypothetical protein
MRWHHILGVLGIALTLASAAESSAQPVPNDRFSANRFVPAPGAGNYLMVDGALVGGHMATSVGAFIDYAHRPFVLFAASCKNGNSGECSVKDSKVNIVAYQLALDAMGTLTLWQRLQLGLLLPVIGTSGDSFFAATPNRGDTKYVDIRGGEAFGLGDPRLSAKVRIVGQGGDGFALGAVAFVTAPLGQVTAKARSLGDATVTGGGHLAADYGVSKLRFSVNLGGVMRPERELLSTRVGPELTYGAGGSFQATPLVRVLGEVTGATHLTKRLDENPIEARVAGELSAGDLALLFGGGAGLVNGVGVPVFRIVGGVSYRPQGLDGDNDGVSDAKDKCPTEKEDRDGFQDEDGCPDLDNDNDGIPDATDKCPDQAEDPDGFQDTDGCPDNDNDNDGIPDGYDSCPDQPEDKDGDRDEDGCPDDDRDRDGIPDAVDKCPDVPEDTDGFGDEDGCPETDFDGDGIPDDEDQCPDQPEDLDGVEDQDGCPEEGAAPPPNNSTDHKRKRTRG